MSNFPLALLAILLAVLAWVTAAEEADPAITRRFMQVIPIEGIGLPEDMVIVGEFEAWAQVTIRAPESVWNALSQADLTASVNLVGLQEGTYQIPIKVKISEKRSPAEIVLIEPQTIAVELQKRIEQTVPVSIQVEGEPAVAYLAQGLVTTPTIVLVSGPRSYVDRVVKAQAAISVQDAKIDVEEMLALQPLDAEGHQVPEVSIKPVAAQVRIPVKLKEDYRTLTVKPIREGLIAYGYTISGFSVEPESVTVSGAPESIASLPGFIETEPISVEGAQNNVVAHPPLNVPADIALLPGQQVTVTYYVEAIQSSVTIEITPTLQNLAPGLTATVSLTSVEVFLSGPLPQLETMEASNVRVILELFELEPGTYQITPQVIVPDGVTDHSVLPSVVQVEISVAPKSTPTPRPSSRAPSTPKRTKE
jgi:YbbR domain-containing protein